MKASEFVKTLPDELQARLSAIVGAVRDGHYLPIEWKMIEIRDAKRAVTLQAYVMCDALQVGEPGDSVRINVSHRTQQQIADILGVSMLTAKLADEIHRHADVLIAPITHNPDKNAIIAVTDPDTGKAVHVSMSSTTAMRAQSIQVDDKLKQLGAQPGQIRSAVCKHWCNSERLAKLDGAGNRIKNKGVNVGWHTSLAKSVSPGGLHLIQPESDWHDWSHADYSQGAVYVHPVMLVMFEKLNRTQVMLYEEVVKDPVASYALSYDGPLTFTRHPDVPPEAVCLAPIPWPWSNMDEQGLTDRRARAWAP